MDNTGLYRAPSYATTDSVSAVSVVDSTKAGAASVNVWTGVSSVSVIPAAPLVVISDTLRFVAAVNGPHPDHRVRWQATRATIDSTGLYTALGTPGRDTVRAISVVDSTRAGMADVTAIIGIESVTLGPESITVFVGDTFRLTATVTGANQDRRIRWSAQRGSITSEGLYTPPDTVGRDVVTARSVVDSSKLDTVEVGVWSHEGLIVEPDSMTVPAGLPWHFRALTSDFPLSAIQWMLEGPGSIYSTWPYWDSSVVRYRAWDNSPVSTATLTASVPTAFRRTSAKVILAPPLTQPTPAIRAAVGGSEYGYLAIDPMTGNVVVTQGGWVKNEGVSAWSAEFTPQWTYSIPSPVAVAGISGPLDVAIRQGDGSIFFTCRDTTMRIMVGRLSANGQVILDPWQEPFLFRALNLPMRIHLAGDTLFMGVLTGAHEIWVLKMDTLGTLADSILVMSPAINVHSLYAGSDYILASGECYCGGPQTNVGGYVAKFSRGGQLLWRRVYGDYADFSAMVDNSGSIYLAGKEYVASGDRWLVVKLDQSGSEVWRRTWDGGNGTVGYGNGVSGIVAEPGGGAIVFGTLREHEAANANYRDFGALDVDADGQVRWTWRWDRAPVEDAKAAALDVSRKRLVLYARVWPYENSPVIGDPPPFMLMTIDLP